MNKITGSIPSTISRLPKLSYLDVSMNKITGAVPLLPWDQYTGAAGYCCLAAGSNHRNDFACPLPAGIGKCSSCGRITCSGTTAPSPAPPPAPTPAACSDPGSECGRTSAGAIVRTGVALDAGRGVVYFGSMANQFYAWNTTSNGMVWNFTAGRVPANGSDSAPADIVSLVATPVSSWTALKTGIAKGGTATFTLTALLVLYTGYI